MKKTTKKKYWILLIVLMVIAVYYYSIQKIHFSNFKTLSNRYLYLFKDSIIYKLDTTTCFSWIANQDTLNHYIFSEDIKKKKLYYEVNDTSYNNYYISIWNFKTLKNVSLKDVIINTNSDVTDAEFKFGETLNPNTFCPISIRCFYKIDGMILNVNRMSIIKKEINGKNYKGFYGLVDRMSICNTEGYPQIYINLKNDTPRNYLNYKETTRPTVLLFYKGEKGFYLILINSRKKFDPNIVDILNLK